MHHDGAVWRVRRWSSALETMMTFEYVSVNEAMSRGGLRMVVAGEVPNPWGEAAKGLLHIKGTEWVAVSLDYDSDALRSWTGTSGS